MTGSIAFSCFASATILAAVLKPVSALYVSSAAVTVSATTTTITSTTLEATATDESVLLVNNEGKAVVQDVVLVKTGDTSSSEDSSFYNLNAAVAVELDGTAILTDCTILSDGVGANGLHTYEDGSSAYVYNLLIEAEGEFSHGIYTAGGYIYAENLSGYTQGTSSSFIATDSGGGTIVVQGAEVYTHGEKSALVYSTGNITVDGLTGATSQSPACVIDGANSWTITNSNITSATILNAVFQFFNTQGSRDGMISYGYITSSSIAETAGTYALIYVSNVESYVYLTDTTVSIASGIFMNITADELGSSGSNGGDAHVVLSDVAVEGDSYVDSISTLELNITASSSLTGAVNVDNAASSVSVYLDSASSWTVTADSYVTLLESDDLTFSNIYSDGYTIYYDSDASTSLGGDTYSLSGGGNLTPV